MATIAFFPEGAYGPTNNCAGIGAVLRERGHRVVFIVEESLAGTLEARGFEERLVRLEPSGSFGEPRGSTLEQLETVVAPRFRALIDAARYVDDRLEEVIGELEPDVIVQDNVVGFPALAACGRPWVRIVSCNPAELKDELVPPAFSGYSGGTRDGWGAYWEEYRRAIAPLAAEHDELHRERGAPGLPELELVGVSPWLNMYVYPAELDYRRAARPAGRWLALESCVREPERAWDGHDDPRPLVYVNLGPADVKLMQGMIDTLALCEELRVVVSLGPQHELLSLPEPMEGAEYLPQTAILPRAQAVITHGGNGTVTECMHFGCPMVVLPLMCDQHDNAQRVAEQGFGVRLNAYEHDRGRLVSALRRLLADAELHARMRAVAARLQRDPGNLRAANAIELVATHALTPASVG